MVIVLIRSFSTVGTLIAITKEQIGGRTMKMCNEMLRRTLALTEQMVEIADQGDDAREDVGCGVLYGLLRDSAYKIRKVAEEEIEAHVRKGRWSSAAKTVKRRPGGHVSQDVQDMKTKTIGGK